MATNAIEAPFLPFQNSHSSQSRHFYLAVDRLQFKMETLKDLLGLVGRRPCLPIVVCCSTHDELDSVCSTLSSLPFISLSVLYCDLAEEERVLILEEFHQVTRRWNQVNHVGTENEDEVGKDEQRSHMIVATDACLPLLASGESPISGHLLINYELPAKKETYMRRMATCLAADGVVINMVVGGEVVTLKSIEESTSIVIQEMPMQEKTEEHRGGEELEKRERSEKENRGEDSYLSADWGKNWVVGSREEKNIALMREKKKRWRRA